MLKLRPYIEALVTSLAIQTEQDAKADGKRLKEIMVTDAEWDAVAELVTVLQPFDDITRFLLSSSYPTMSVVYPAMMRLKKTTFSGKTSVRGKTTNLEQAESRSSSLGIDPIEDYSDAFGCTLDHETAEEELEPLKNAKNVVTAVRMAMAQLFENHYKVGL